VDECDVRAPVEGCLGVPCHVVPSHHGAPLLDHLRDVRAGRHKQEVMVVCARRDVRAGSRSKEGREGGEAKPRQEVTRHRGAPRKRKRWWLCVRGGQHGGCGCMYGEANIT
jgi:hypothetical protein